MKNPVTAVRHLLHHRFAPYLAIIFTQLPILLKIYSWEPDQHHDGVMFATAIAVSNGDLPNRDAFAQYGPVTPLLQGIWLYLTSPTVLNMRRLSVIIIIAISVLMYYLLKQVAGISLAILLSFTWVLSGPFGLPWSSLLTTIMSLGLIALIGSANSPGQSTRIQSLFLSIAGFICAIGFFTRIHFILISLAVLLYLKLSLRNQKNFRINYFDISFFLSLSLILVLMQFLNLLSPYINQCIIWAFGKYSTAPELSKSLLIDFLWIPTIAFVFLIMLFLMGFPRNAQSNLSKSIPFVLILLVALTSVFSSRLARTGEQTLRNPKILLIDASQKFLYGVGYSAITFLIILALHFLVKQKNAIRKFPPAVWIAAASLAQLYPFFDPHHVWFISPILIVAVVTLAESHKFPLRKLIRSGLKPFLAIILTALFVQLGLNAGQNRYQYTSPQMLGMSSIWRSADEIDRTLLALNRSAIPNSVQFECADGLFAVANGKYLANSPMFVTWGPSIQSASTAKQLFACYLDDNQINSYLNKGYDIVFMEKWQPLTFPVDRHYWNVLFTLP